MHREFICYIIELRLFAREQRALSVTPSQISCESRPDRLARQRTVSARPELTKETPELHSYFSQLGTIPSFTCSRSSLGDLRAASPTLTALPFLTSN